MWETLPEMLLNRHNEVGEHDCLEKEPYRLNTFLLYSVSSPNRMGRENVVCACRRERLNHKLGNAVCGNIDKPRAHWAIQF